MIANNENIDIVLASDEKYLPFAYITIYSVLQHRVGTYFITFYIMVQENTHITEYDRYWKFQNYKIEYIPIPEYYFEDIGMTISHITKPTYYRLIIAKYLDADRCLYLDVDVLVYKDLKNLYYMDLEKYYMAAGRGTSILRNEDSDKAYADYLGIPDMDNYINAGVILFNLKKIREDKLVEEFLQCAKNGWICQDQDVLNKCCCNAIKIFEFQYNIYSVAYGYKKEWLKNIFEETEIENALNNPAIVHYATKVAKPWLNINAMKGKEWWDCAENALSKEIYVMLKTTAAATKIDEIPYYIGLIKKVSAIIIMGAGKVGKKLYDYMDMIASDKKIILFDNGENQISYKGVKIERPYYVQEHNHMVIISIQKHDDTVIKQLEDLGYERDRIFQYRGGDIENWFSYDEEYRNGILESNNVKLYWE